MNYPSVDPLLPPAPQIHHVGIVLPTFEAAHAYMAMFNHVEAYRGEVREFECWCLFCEAPEGQTAIELVVPTGGPLARFNRGVGGVHHFAIETPDLRALQKDFAEQNIPMLCPVPVKGAGNFLCNFLNPSVTRGIIVEYVQLL